MLRTKRLIAVCVACLAVAATVLALRTALAPPGEPSFLALVREEAPLRERSLEHREQFAEAATEDPEFRDWLVSLVTNPDRPIRPRTEALATLLAIEDGAVMREVAGQLIDGLEHEKVTSHQDVQLIGQARNYLVLKALLSDWPLEDTLDVIRRASPGWRSIAEAHANRKPDQPTGWSPEQQAKLTARAKAVLELADRKDAESPGSGDRPTGGGVGPEGG
jgi:hypothetical protein